MRLGQAGHQRRAATVYDLCAVRLELVAAFSDCLNPESLDQNLARKLNQTMAHEEGLAKALGGFPGKAGSRHQAL